VYHAALVVVPTVVPALAIQLAYALVHRMPEPFRHRIKTWSYHRKPAVLTMIGTGQSPKVLVGPLRFVGPLTSVGTVSPLWPARCTPTTRISGLQTSPLVPRFVGPPPVDKSWMSDIMPDPDLMSPLAAFILTTLYMMVKPRERGEESSQADANQSASARALVAAGATTQDLNFTDLTWFTRLTDSIDRHFVTWGVSQYQNRLQNHVDSYFSPAAPLPLTASDGSEVVVHWTDGQVAAGQYAAEQGALWSKENALLCKLNALLRWALLVSKLQLTLANTDNTQLWQRALMCQLQKRVDFKPQARKQVLESSRNIDRLCEIEAWMRDMARKA
jgi:hypothetical protein